MDGNTILAVTDENGAIQHWNLYGNELVGRQKANSDRRFYIYDHLGSTRQVCLLHNSYFQFIRLVLLLGIFLDF